MQSQTRAKRKIYVETALDPEAIKDVRSSRGVRIQSKHKHTDVTGERECRKLNR